MNAQLSQDIDKALADLEAVELKPVEPIKAPPTSPQRFPWAIALAFAGGVSVGAAGAWLLL